LSQKSVRGIAPSPISAESLDTMTPLVSILIPAYNAERWICSTIGSALRQTWPRKEIIVVDDGSKDSTFQLACRHEAHNLKVVRQDNMGGGSARNRLLSLAQGDYIQWLDHDDQLAPDKIELQMRQAANDRTLLSGTFSTFFFSIDRAVPVVNSMCRNLTPVDFFLSKFNDDAWLQIGAYLMSRRLGDAAGPWYEQQCTDDDGEYLARVVSVCESILFVPDAQSYWRIGNRASAGHREKGKNLEAVMHAITQSIQQLLLLEDSERTRQACLRFLQFRIRRYFYPNEKEMLRELASIAKGLGGTLTLPQTGWRFSLVKSLFGWQAAAKADNIRYAADMFLQRNIDRYFHRRLQRR
jgi:glycosyltransferase involved in cell wall biosynthesis